MSHTTTANPYRSASTPAHIPAIPLDPAWRSYKRRTLFYNVLLWAAVLFFAGLLVFDPTATILALPLLPLPFFFLWLGIRDSACPSCSESIVTGPLQMSYTRSLLGLFPQYCTHCSVDVPDGPTQPECECSTCARR